MEGAQHSRYLPLRWWNQPMIHGAFHIAARAHTGHSGRSWSAVQNFCTEASAARGFSSCCSRGCTFSPALTFVGWWGVRFVGSWGPSDSENQTPSISFAHAHPYSYLRRFFYLVCPGLYEYG